MSPTLVLASGSPRRRELLDRLDLDFTIRPAPIDETILPGEDAETYVHRLAAEKARFVAHPGELVLAADTIVVLDGDVLGKPTDAADARRMLARLQGREHVVLTSVALYDGSTAGLAQATARTEVAMGALEEEEIAWYAATGEPLDKAGSYGAQGLGALFVEELRGNYSNVIGLPLPATYRLFRELGTDLRAFRRPCQVPH